MFLKILNRKMTFWLLLIAIFLVLLMVVFNSVPWAEKKTLFYPSKKSHWSPDIPHDNVYIDVKYTDSSHNVYHHRPSQKYCGSYIHGWYFNNFPGHKTVMFCHGNSGNITHRQYIVNICQKFELNLFIFDYRGFGRSSGRPTKRNLKKDGEAAYKFLTGYAGVNSDNIIIWGESLGGFVATWTASKYPCRSLILLSTFSGLDDAITNYFDPGVKQSLAYGYSSLVSLRYDIMPSRQYIRKVRCPVAIAHSKTDDIIPYKCAKILYDNVMHNSKVLIDIKGGHSSPVITHEDLNKIFMFCDISLPVYDQVCDVDGMLKDIETVAERYHNFMD